MWHWSIILLLVCLLSASFVARYAFLTWFEHVLGVKDVKIGHFHAMGLGGVSNIQWEGNQVTWANAHDRQEQLQRTVVSVDRVKPHWDKDPQGNKTFFGILIQGVEVRIPKNHLAHHLDKLHSSDAQTSNRDMKHCPGADLSSEDMLRLSARAPSKWRRIRYLLGRALLITFRWFRSLIFRRLLFGVRFVNVTVTLEDVGQLDFNFGLGLQHVDTVTTLNAPIQAYLAISELAISPFPLPPQSAKGQAPTAAFEIPRPVWLSIRTSDLHKVSLWNVARRRIPPKAFRIDLFFPPDEHHIAPSAPHMADVFVQLDKLLTIYQAAQSEYSKRRPRQTVKRRADGEAHSSVHTSRSRPQGRQNHRSPIHYINAVFIDIPSIECQYAPPELQQHHVALRSKINRVRLVASLGELFAKGADQITDIPGLEHGHRRWIGSSDIVPLACQASWDSCIWELQTATSSKISAHPAPADLALSQLRLGQLKVATTSNFAPWHRIEEMQERIVCEARFKPSSLDLQHENVEMFVRHVLPMFSASIGQQEKTMQLRPRRNSDKTLLQRLWPCIVFHIDIDECVAVLSGPDQPSTLPSQWTNTHQFRLRTPTISISAESNYHFLSVPLTDSRIREAQEAEERQKRKSEKRERSQTNDASRYRTSAVASNAALLFTSDTAAHSSFLDRSDRFPSHTSNTVYSAVYHTSISIASTHAIEISLQSASEGSQTGTSTFETTPVDRPSSPQDQWSFEDSALDPVSTRMFVLGPFDASSTFTFPLLDDGRSYSLQLDSKTGSVDVSFGRVELALWQHPMLSFLEDVSALMAEVTLPAKPSGDGGRPHTVHDSFSSLSVHCFAEAISLEVCGQDPSRDPDISRGLALVVRDIVCNAFTDRDWSASKIGDQARDRLHLQPQLPQSSGKNLDVTPHAALMIVDVDFQRFTLSPIIDAAKAASLGSTLEEEVMAMPAFVSHKEFMKVPRKEHLVPEDWEHTGRYSFASSQSSPLSSEQCINEADERVLTVAASSIRVIRQHHPVPSTSHSLGPNALASTHVQVQGSVLAFSFKLFHVYSCLVSASAIKRIYAVYRQHSSGKNAVSTENTTPCALTWSVTMPNAFLLLALADDCEVHAHLKSVKAADASVTCDILHLAVPSPTAHRFWSTILQLHGARLRFSKTNTGQLRGLDISLQGHSLRFRIPYKYQAHHFVDEAVSVAKSCKQVYSQLLLGLPSSVLEPHPEGPKHLPRFECSLSEVAIEAEDDPLENRLNLSRRVGTQEARNRLERAAALEAKEKEAIEIFAPNEAAAMLEAARIHLRKYDASELTHRLRNAFAEQGKREETLYRRLEGDFPFSREASPLQLTASNKACPLVRAIFYGFYVQISPPSSFPPTLDGVKAYLNEVGGMPTDRDFSLLAPLHIRWTITDARIRLRDYPLPLVHLPQSAHANKEHRPAWNFDSDFVIAEQIPEAEALRYTVQELVPATYSGASDQGHHIVVPRSAMPTQFYGLPRIHLSPDKQVTMGWGNSMQPALNDVARVVESLTKPSPDPSPRLGFWDKLRLSVHGKLVMTSSVDLHVHLKGSRDPYALEGAGAGFVKIWRGNVKLLVNCTNNDHELLQILSDRYVLGVPDLTPYIDSAAAGMSGSDSPSEGSFQPGGSHGDSLPVQVSLQKTLGVLVNGVRWGMGFRLERTCARGHCPRAQPCEGNKFQRKCRVFEFRPHYDVKTRLEAGPKDENGKIVDSFASFRSDFIHFSISLVSPVPSQTPQPQQTEDALNGLRLAPLVDQHFWRWWTLFDSSLSLPIRQGGIFHSPPPAPKFGRTTATIKYRFDVAPFFVAHTYRQEAAVDWHLGQTTVLGGKVKFNSAKIDLHQRTEEFVLQRRELGSKRIYHKKFYRAQIHGDDVDARLIAARFLSPMKQLVAEETDWFDAGSASAEESGRETSWIDSIPTLSGEDRSQWENQDDFDDLGAEPLGEPDIIKIIPLMSSPACTYSMQPVDFVTSSKSQHSRPVPKGSVARSSKFGDELSHVCLVGNAPGTMSIQLRYVEQRIETLRKLLAEDDGETLPGVSQTRRQELEARTRSLERRRDAVHEAFSLSKKRQGQPIGDGLHALFGHTTTEFDTDFASALLADQHNYSQRLQLHQPHIQVNTTTRDVLFKYWDSSRSRKGFSYQLSSAVLSATRKLESEVRMQAPRSPAASERTTESEQVDDAIDSAVEACHSDYWSDKAAHQHSAPSGSRSRKESILPSHDAPKNMNPEWSVESSFLATFAQPQFHLQSDADDGADAVATAEVAVLRTFAVSDPSSEDATHSTILHRNYGELRTLQVFYPQPDRVKALYREQATSFVPLEVIFDGSLRYECDCMVGSTHLSIRFDKFNRLRMNNIGHARFHHEAPEAFHQGRDEITLSMGQFEVAATRTQFAGLLHIFQKLALYTNPDRKRKNERVETARLTADYSDPKFMVRWIEDKQKAIRKLHDRLNDASQVNNTYQYYCIHAEALSESERLNTYLQVMSEAQDQYDVENKRRKGDLSIRARSSQIVLSMLDQEHRPFVKAAIKDIGFKWRSHEDGSLTNQLVIGSITADNYLPDAQFLEILYPLNDATLEKDFPLKGKNVVMAAMWSVLPPVGGVSIVDDLQLFLHPINLLLEQRTATMCWDYFFDAKSQVTKSTAREKQQRSSNRPQPYLQSSLKSPDHLSVPSPPPSSSSLNSSAMNSGPSIRSSRSSEGIQNQRSPHWEEEIGSGLSQKDVQIMRDRARTFRTFLRVDMPDTLVYLTYRNRPGQRSWKDTYGLEFKTPHFNYTNKAWSWSELFGAIRRDAKTHLFAQSGTLVNQLVGKARNPKNIPSPTSVIKKLTGGMRQGESPEGAAGSNLIHPISEETEVLSPQTSTASASESAHRHLHLPRQVHHRQSNATPDLTKHTWPSSGEPVGSDEDHPSGDSPIARSPSERQEHAQASMHFADSAIDRRPTILAEDGQRIEEGDELSAPTPSPENFSFEDETHRHRLKPRERAHTLKDALKRSLKRH